MVLCTGLPNTENKQPHKYFYNVHSVAQVFLPPLMTIAIVTQNVFIYITKYHLVFMRNHQLTM